MTLVLLLIRHFFQQLLKKADTFSHFSRKIYVVGTYYKCLSEVLLMSTNNLFSQNKKNMDTPPSNLELWIIPISSSTQQYLSTRKTTAKIQRPWLFCLFLIFFFSMLLSTIFQLYLDSVWMWQGAEYSFSECCLTIISCPWQISWFSTQSHYTDTGLISSSSSQWPYIPYTNKLNYYCYGP